MVNRKKNTAWLKWVFFLLVVAGGVIAWKTYGNRPKETAPDFKTATVAYGDLVQTVTANGQLSPVKSVVVGSQVSGIIVDIKADFNSVVTNGQVIAQVDPSTYRQMLTLAEAEMANAEAARELAMLNYRRASSLRTNDLINQSEYEKAMIDLKQSDAVIKMRAASVNKAKVDLERTTIYSPIDGVVISRAVDVGQTVAASFNTPTLFNIANDLRKMRIEAMVSEADVGGVREGQQVTFNVDAYMNQTFWGVVTQVRFAPITNQNVVNYTCIVEVRNDDLRLRPGMTANANIIIATRSNVLCIPSSAFRFRPSEKSIVKGVTNAPAATSVGSGKTVAATSGPSETGGAQSNGGGTNSGEKKRRMEGMSPEEREKMRAARGRGEGMGAGGAGGRRSSAAETNVRTVYVVEKEVINGIEQTVLKPVTVKIGINDSMNTEILEGLKEGDVVATVSLQSMGMMAGGMRPGGSPFGGPFGGMRPPR